MLTVIVSSISANENLKFVIIVLSLVFSALLNLQKYEDFKTNNPSLIPHSFVERTIGFVITTLGGGILLGLLLGHGPSWLYSESFVLTALLVWCGLSFVWSVAWMKNVASPVLSSKLSLAILLLAATLVDGYCLTEGGVEHALLFSESTVQTIPAAVLSGVFSVIGGGILGELLNVHDQWGFQRSSTLRSTKAVLVITFSLSLLYTLALPAVQKDAIIPTDGVDRSVDSLMKVADFFGLGSFLEQLVPLQTLAPKLGANSSAFAPQLDRIFILSPLVDIYRSLFVGYSPDSLQSLFISIFTFLMYIENLGAAGFFKFTPKKAPVAIPPRPLSTSANLSNSTDSLKESSQQTEAGITKAAVSEDH